ncbi:hypothetical protein HK098_004113 [Nowakowskiella sp. JEL0407]|nr:hypothetical protein HK098_004113 [Nowakowskiella sp. JEL0407]
MSSTPTRTNFRDLTIECVQSFTLVARKYQWDHKITSDKNFEEFPTPSASTSPVPPSPSPTHVVDIPTEPDLYHEPDLSAGVEVIPLLGLSSNPDAHSLSDPSTEPAPHTPPAPSSTPAPSTAAAPAHTTILRRAAFAFPEDDNILKTPSDLDLKSPTLFVPEHKETLAPSNRPIPKNVPKGIQNFITSVLNVSGIPVTNIANSTYETLHKLTKYVLFSSLKNVPNPTMSKWKNLQKKHKSPEVISEELKYKQPVWRLAYKGSENIDELRKIDSIGCHEYMKQHVETHSYNEIFASLHECSESTSEKECFYTPGSYGENILHKLVLWLITSNDIDKKEEFFDIIRYILDQEHHRRRLINSTYEGKEYYGETVLHLAIAQQSKLNESMINDSNCDVEANGLFTAEEKEAIDYLVKRKYLNLNFNETPEGKALLQNLSVENRLLIYLLERGADPHIACANGDFFSTENAQYIAGSVLGIATRLGNRFAMELLLQYSRADPNVTDTYGNTPLHLLAWFGIHSWKKALSQELSLPFHGIYRSSPEGILRVNREVRLDHTTMGGPWTVLKAYGAYRNQKNRRYQTPLILALYKKHSTTASKIVEDTKIMRWNWAGILGSLYDINALEPPKEPPSVVKNFQEAISLIKEIIYHYRKKKLVEDFYHEPIIHNALEIIIHNEDYKSLLMIPVLQILLEAKWILYAKWMFYTNFAATTIYMILFSINILFLLPRGDKIDDKRTNYGDDVVRKGVEVTLLAGTLLSFVLKLSEFLRFGIVSYFWSGYSPRQNVLLFCWNIIFSLDIYYRYALKTDEENVCLSLLVLIGWFRILHFAQGIRTVGPLVNIIAHIIWEDFFKRFFLVYLVVYLAFSQALWLQMGDLDLSVPDKRPDDKWWFDPFAGLLRVWSYQVDQNDSQFNTFFKSKFPAFTIILYSLYIFITFVLLINVLIAMLSNTFTKTAEYTDRLWLLRWANLILDLENQMSFSELVRFRQTLGMAVDIKPADSTVTNQQTGRFLWIQTIQGTDGQKIPTRIVTNEIEEFDIGAKILDYAGQRFNSDTWQNAEDERRLRNVESIVGGKRLHF